MIRTPIFAASILVVTACSATAGDEPVRDARWSSADGAFVYEAPGGWHVESGAEDVTDGEISAPRYQLTLRPDPQRDRTGFFSPLCVFSLVDSSGVAEWVETFENAYALTPEEKKIAFEEAWLESSGLFLSSQKLRDSVCCPPKEIEYLRSCTSAETEGFSLSSTGPRHVAASWRHKFGFVGRQPVYSFARGELYMTDRALGMRACYYSSYQDRAWFGAADLDALQAAIEQASAQQPPIFP